MGSGRKQSPAGRSGSPQRHCSAAIDSPVPATADTTPPHAAHGFTGGRPFVDTIMLPAVIDARVGRFAGAAVSVGDQYRWEASSEGSCFPKQALRKAPECTEVAEGLF